MVGGVAVALPHLTGCALFKFVPGLAAQAGVERDESLRGLGCHAREVRYVARRIQALERLLPHRFLPGLALILGLGCHAQTVFVGADDVYATEV